MPYAIKPSGDKFKVINKKTGRVFGTHSSKTKAEKQLAALHINTHESKFTLKQDIVIESNGLITVISEGSGIVVVDRYSALGMEPPNTETMCKGECEGTGYVPTFNPEFETNNQCRLVDETPLSPILLTLWQAAQQANPTDDGWHFVQCPDCNGSGEEDILWDRTAPNCPMCDNKLMKARGVGYTHGCMSPENHRITVVGNKAVEWDRTKDHYARLKGLSESKTISETIMDKAFDEFNQKFQYTVGDGYYEIDSIIDDFVCYLVENFGWYINRHSKNRGDMLPSFKEYVWLVNRAYPNMKLVITDIGNNKLKVQEKGL